MMMNSIEERDNLIRLLQEALKFYANQENYKGSKNASVCCSGISVSLVEIDEGTQARFALNKAKELAETNQKIQDDYDRLILDAEELESTGETNPIELINIFLQTRDEDNNVQ